MKRWWLFGAIVFFGWGGAYEALAGPLCGAGNAGTCETFTSCGGEIISDSNPPACTVEGTICCGAVSRNTPPGTGGSTGTGSTGSTGASGTTGSSAAAGGRGCPNNYEPVAGVCFPKSSVTGLSNKPVIEIVKNLLSWLLGIFGFIAIMGFVISGVQYLVSAGDEGMAETAKRNMQYSIIGIIVALSGWIVIQAVEALLGGTGLI